MHFKNWLVADYAVGDTVRYKGNYYQANVAINASNDPIRLQTSIIKQMGF